MPHNAAACIIALRAAMEALVVEVTKDPDIIRQLDPVNERMLNVIRQISRPSAAGISLMAANARLAQVAGGAGQGALSTSALKGHQEPEESWSELSSLWLQEPRAKITRRVLSRVDRSFRFRFKVGSLSVRKIVVFGV